MASVTSAQRNAAKNLGSIASFNAKSTKDQFTRTEKNYDQADTQNRALAKLQYGQNSRKSAGERFAQNKKLQMSTSSILGAAGNALQGSQLGALTGMLRSRTDLDTGEVLDTLRTNQDAVRNAQIESINANNLARNDAATAAEFALRGIEADTAAQLNNLNPKLFVKPGTGKTKAGSAGYAKKRKAGPFKVTPAGYFTAPASTPRASTAKVNTGSDYFDKLLSSY